MSATGEMLQSSAIYWGYRAGDALAQRIPPRLGAFAARHAADLALRVGGERERQVHRNLDRIYGGDITAAEKDELTAATFRNYARYWYELFSLGDPKKISQVPITVNGFEHVEDATDHGSKGAIIAMPHLGNRDVAGAWLGRQGYSLTVVAEAVNPPKLLEWFIERRRQVGVDVVVLGEDKIQSKLSAALDAGRSIGLLCDRDIAGNGIGVKFFGEQTTIPAGPAVLALRHNVPIIPTGFYFEPDGEHFFHIDEPIEPSQVGRPRDRIESTTQEIVSRFEGLIREDPTSWLMMQPNWSSDHQTA